MESLFRLKAHSLHEHSQSLDSVPGALPHLMTRILSSDISVIGMQGIPEADRLSYESRVGAGSSNSNGPIQGDFNAHSVRKDRPNGINPPTLSQFESMYGLGMPSGPKSDPLLECNTFLFFDSLDYSCQTCEQWKNKEIIINFVQITLKAWLFK